MMEPAELLQCLQRIGWSIRELARRTDIRHTTAVHWAHGRLPVPAAVATWLRRVANWMDRNPAPVWRPPPHNLKRDPE